MEWPTVTSQSSVLPLAALALSAVVAVDTVRRLVRDHTERKRYPLPPGPTPLPLLGSTLSIDVREPWLTYTSWRAKYGDVMYIRLLDSDVIVLNSYSDAKELLDKRSQMYSDRPFLATIEPYGHGSSIAFVRYGAHWRLGRRIIHQTFRSEAALAFRPMQLQRARQIAINVIDGPKEYPHHFATFAAAVATSAVYDYEPQLIDDPVVKLADDFCKLSFPALTPEKAVLLKAFPFLLSVPLWIPGLSRIRREASKSYDMSIKVIEMPYQVARKRMAAKEDVFANTMVFDHVQRMEKMDDSSRAEYETVLKQAAWTALLGAVETTSSTLMTFTLAMVKNPRVWSRAQEEIDAVIGTDRLPEYEDRPSLPYVSAVMRETLRWRPVTPMGVPHAVTSDDVYKGHYIPNGATVFANIWAMTRDEARYPDPESFIPERFLNQDGTLNDNNPADFVFGFGRRVCAGRYTADASAWIAIATLLATLDFNVAKDANGNDVEFEPEFANGVSYHPVPFPCCLAPRAHITKEVLECSLTK